MAHAYTPGLRVAERAQIQTRRVLPLHGEVLVQVGQQVTSDAPVARTSLPGDVHSVNVANRLSIAPEDIKDFMLKREGDPVEKDEPIAENRPWIKLFKSVVRSPVKGKVESVSPVTGQVLLREPPKPVEVRAYVDGRVIEVIEREGAVVECFASFIQGIFGVGGETEGRLEMVADSPDAVLDVEDMAQDGQGKILVGGALISLDAVLKAKEEGVRGIIVGGFHDQDLRELLGYDLGVAITGAEQVGLTLILTEGFGRIAMAQRTFGLLKAKAGRKACINGATQIRAGVMRPEIIIPHSDAQAAEESAAGGQDGLSVGHPVRIIREPRFGQIGRVKALPTGLQPIETEAKVRVLNVELEDGTEIVVPRANVEIIQG